MVPHIKSLQVRQLKWTFKKKKLSDWATFPPSTGAISLQCCLATARGNPSARPSGYFSHRNYSYKTDKETFFRGYPIKCLYRSNRGNKIYKKLSTSCHKANKFEGWHAFKNKANRSLSLALWGDSLTATCASWSGSECHSLSVSRSTGQQGSIFHLACQQVCWTIYMSVSEDTSQTAVGLPCNDRACIKVSFAFWAKIDSVCNFDIELAWQLRFNAHQTILFLRIYWIHFTEI